MSFDAVADFFGIDLSAPVTVEPVTYNVEPSTVPFWQVCGYPDEQSYNRAASRLAQDVREAHNIEYRRSGWLDG